MDQLTKKTELLNLLVKCTVLGGNPEKCPLVEIRKMGWQNRLKWVAKLNNSEIDDIFKYHNQCYAQK